MRMFLLFAEYYGFIEDPDSVIPIKELEKLLSQSIEMEHKEMLDFVLSVNMHDLTTKCSEYETPHSEFRTSSLKLESGILTIPSKMNDTDKENDRVILILWS